MSDVNGDLRSMILKRIHDAAEGIGSSFDDAGSICDLFTLERIAIALLDGLEAAASEVARIDKMFSELRQSRDDDARDHVIRELHASDVAEGRSVVSMDYFRRY